MDLTRVTDFVDRIARRVGPVMICWLAGLLWLSNANWKTPPNFGKSDTGCGGLCDFTSLGIEYPVAPGSAALFEHVILPNLQIFGWITLFVEVGLAATLLSGRFLRTAGVVGMLMSVSIGMAVANAPNEWFWAYLLMFGLHAAVLVLAPTLRPIRVRTVAWVTMAYGLIVAVTHAQAGLTGDGDPGWTLFAGADGMIRDIPDEFGRNTFTGSLALGAVFVLVGLGAWACTKLAIRQRQVVGWVAVAVAAIVLLTYRSSGLVIGMGSTAVSAGVLAMVGLSLTARERVPQAV